jgi:hypothetical protein
MIARTEEPAQAFQSWAILISNISLLSATRLAPNGLRQNSI